MKTKEQLVELDLNKAEEKVFDYLEWLENTNRLTIEEKNTLERYIKELEAAAIVWSNETIK